MMINGREAGRVRERLKIVPKHMKIEQLPPSGSMVLIMDAGAHSSLAAPSFHIVHPEQIALGTNDGRHWERCRAGVLMDESPRR